MSDLGWDDKKLIDAYYSSVYDDVHYHGPLGWFTSRYHRELEAYRNTSGQNILDIGGGAGEHLLFVKAIPVTYTILDPSPSIGIRAQSFADENGVQLVTIEGRGEDIPFREESFDRVVITCVLLHAEDPAKMIREAYRVLKSGGTMSIYLPSDPGMLYRLIRHLTSHRRTKKISEFSMEQVKYIWSLEHTNHVAGLIIQIRYTLREFDLEEVRFPLGIPGWNFNLFRVYHLIK